MSKKDIVIRREQIKALFYLLLLDISPAAPLSRTLEQIKYEVRLPGKINFNRIELEALAEKYTEYFIEIGK